MKKTAILRAMALVSAMGLTMPANAATYIVNFVVQSSSWSHDGTPYGTSGTAALFGSFLADSTKTGRDAISNINYATGSKSWSAGELASDTNIYFDGSGVVQFGLKFDATNYVYSNNTVQFREHATEEYAWCNYCVSFNSNIAPVPEPASWALMIGGFAVTGTALRRRQAMKARFA